MCPGLTARTIEEFRAALAEAKDDTEPILIEVKVTDGSLLPVEAYPLRRGDRPDFEEFVPRYEASDLHPFAEILAEHGVALDEGIRIPDRRSLSACAPCIRDLGVGVRRPLVCSSGAYHFRMSDLSDLDSLNRLACLVRWVSRRTPQARRSPRDGTSVNPLDGGTFIGTNV